MINLQSTITTSPDLCGWHYYVFAGFAFDADVYAEASGLNEHDINPADIHAVQDAAGRLNPGEFLQVTHTIESD
jgi:hypothetical protein